MKTAVLIPCYNEEKTIGKVIKDVKEHLGHADIYVYDNNSTDNTASIAQELGAIVRKEPRQGKGNVVREMFRAIEADCYIMLDGDDTYPASACREMERLVLEEGIDMVIGDRLSSTYFTENKRLFHNSGNKIVRRLINFLFKAEVKDIMTGARSFSHDFVKSFPVLSKGFEIETEMTIFALDHNFKMKEVPIEYKDRPQGSESKLNTYQDGAKVLLTIVKFFKDYKPFLFFVIIGLIFGAGGVIGYIPVLTEYFSTGIVLKFPTLIVATCLGIVAMGSVFCGVILSVIRKQYKQSFERDLNLIRSMKNEKKD